MYAPKKLSKNKMMMYLAALGLVAIMLLGYLYFNYAQNQAAENQAIGGTDSDSFNLSDIAVMAKPKFDVKKLKEFDLKLFNDQRFKNLAEFYNEVGVRSAVGRNNPFDPFKKATSTKISDGN